MWFACENGIIFGSTETSTAVVHFLIRKMHGKLNTEHHISEAIKKTNITECTMKEIQFKVSHKLHLPFY